MFLDYPLALVAIAVLLLLYESLGRRWRRRGRGDRALRGGALAGRRRPGDLDAKPSNAIAACGVAVAMALTVAVWRAAGHERSLDRTAAPLRLALAAVVPSSRFRGWRRSRACRSAGVPVLGTL